MPVCLFALHYACLSVCLALCVSVCHSFPPSPFPSPPSPTSGLSLCLSGLREMLQHTHTHTQDFKAKNESMTKAERDELMAHRRALEQEVSCLIEPKRLTLVAEA